MKTIYIADDRKMFSSYRECEKYEYLLNRPWLKTIEFYDKCGKRIFVSEKEYGLIWSDDRFYEAIECIVIHDNDELVAFMNFAHEAGYISFQTIDSVGEWKMNYKTYDMKRVGE